MRQMNELFNKHERVWFSLLGEESQRQFLQAIHDYDPASTAAPDQIGSHMAYGKDKQLRYVSWLVWTQTFGQEGFPVRVDFQKYISGAEDFYIKEADSHMV